MLTLPNRISGLLPLTIRSGLMGTITEATVSETRTTEVTCPKSRLETVFEFLGQTADNVKDSLLGLGTKNHFVLRMTILRLITRSVAGQNDFPFLPQVIAECSLRQMGEILDDIARY